MTKVCYWLIYFFTTEQIKQQAEKEKNRPLTEEEKLVEKIKSQIIENAEIDNQSKRLKSQHKDEIDEVLLEIQMAEGELHDALLDYQIELENSKKVDKKNQGKFYIKLSL